MKKEKKGKKIKLKKTKKIDPIVLLICFIMLVFLTPVFVSTAKYVYNAIYEHYLESQDFYFTSDRLSINHTEFEVTNNWSGAESKTIPITLSSKKNDLAYTKSDITYTVEIVSKSNNITCTPDKNSGTIVGTDNHGSNIDGIELTIAPAGNTALPEGSVAWVEVKVTSTAPYSQVLTGRISIEVGSSDITYEIMDAVNQPYLTVSITNSQSSAANITLNYSPTVVLLDMTSRFRLNATASTTQQLNGYAYLNSITSSVDSLTTKTVKFYKVNPSQNYSYVSGSAGTPIITLTH